MIKKVIQVVFQKGTKQMLPYIHSWNDLTKYDVINNYEFTETLKFNCICLGRSAVNIHWVDANGIVYYMFMKDFVHLMGEIPLIDHGKVTAKFTFVKRGANYGIKLV